MDLQWQAELQARDQRLEMAQKELANKVFGLSPKKKIRALF